MEKETKVVKKIKHYLKNISKEKKDSEFDKNLLELLDHSIFSYEEKDYYGDPYYDLQISVTPDICAKNHHRIEGFQLDLEEKVNIFPLKVNKVIIIPDLDQYEIGFTEVFPIHTIWNKINEDQLILIHEFDKSNNSINYSNIGNSARNLMNKLAFEVFDEKKHRPSDSKMELTKGKFKNQLKTYIENELKGRSNKYLRNIAKSSVDFVCNSIDLMSATTHKLDAKKHFAELCVIGAISTISIVKTIYEMNNLNP